MSNRRTPKDGWPKDVKRKPPTVKKDEPKVGAQIAKSGLAPGDVFEAGIRTYLIVSANDKLTGFIKLTGTAETAKMLADQSWKALVDASVVIPATVSMNWGTHKGNIRKLWKD